VGAAVMLAEVALAWTVDRAAGIAALMFASGSVVLGVMASFGKVKDAKAAHEALSLATIAAIGVHGVAFVLDPFFKAGVVGAVVPFASPYRPVAVAIGQLAGYGLIAFGLTYYVRGRIGPARWKKAHRVVPVFWAMGILHAILAGTDVEQPWFIAAAVAPVLAGLVAVAARWEARSARVPRPGGPEASPRTQAR